MQQKKMVEITKKIKSFKLNCTTIKCSYIWNEKGKNLKLIVILVKLIIKLAAINLVETMMMAVIVNTKSLHDNFKKLIFYKNVLTSFLKYFRSTVPTNISRLTKWYSFYFLNFIEFFLYLRKEMYGFTAKLLAVWKQLEKYKSA